MFYRTPFVLLLFISLTTGNLSIAATSGSAFTPECTDPFLESWRWNILEVATDKNVQAIATAPDNTLWMVFPGNTVVCYDGEHIERFPLKGLPGGSNITQLHITKSYGVYVLTTAGLFVQKNKTWHQLTDAGVRYEQTRAISDLKNGSLVYCHTKGMCIIRDSKVLQNVPVENGILSATEDLNGNLWVLEAATGNIYHVLKEDSSLSDRVEWTTVYQGEGMLRHSGNLLTDKNGKLWYINTRFKDGVKVYSPSTGVWDSHNMRILGGNNYNVDIIESHDGKIMVSGRSSLNVFDGEKWNIYKQPHYIASNGRPLIKQSSDGFLYLLESGINVYQIDYSGRNWEGYENLHFQDESSAGALWYLSVDGRVVVRENKHKWLQFSQEDGIMETPMRVKILQNGDVVCIGSEDGSAAISIFDGEKWTKSLHGDFSSSFTRKSIAELADGSFLIGSPLMEPNKNKGGIIKFTRQNGSYSSMILDPENTPESAHCIIETKDGEIWTSSESIKVFSDQHKLRKQNPPSWNFHWIEHLVKGVNDSIWVSVWAEGVFRYNPTDGWSKFTEESGLISNTVSYMQALKNGDIFVTSNKGFYLYKNGNWVKQFNKCKRIARDRGSLRESNDGSIWMNHSYIDWYYRWRSNPEHHRSEDEKFYTIRYIPDREYPQTQFDNTPDSKLISANTLTLRWSGSDKWSKTPQENLLYSYRIDGGKWSTFSEETFLETPPLEKGNHKIEVRAVDDELNVDPSPAVFEFVVVIPFWRQPWFYLAIVVMAALIIGLIVAMVRLKIKHIAELDELRNRFFTNLSHELRTPLTLMMFSLERLGRMSHDTNNQEEISQINLNATRMLNLVEQLLDFRKTEQGKTTIHTQPIELVSFSKGLLSVFEVHALEKNQTLSFESSHAVCTIDSDPDLYQKIVDNLISNAIKYTDSWGQISFKLVIESQPQTSTISKGLLKIVVEDSGIGIHSKDKANIFEPFYRERDVLSQKGSGIGLALVKDLVNILGGKIEVESPIHDSSETPGCRFTVSLPINEFLSLDEKKVEVTIYESSEKEPEATHVDLKHDNASRKIVLIIEDNPEIRHQLELELQTDYNVLTAENGKHGLERAVQTIPDIIIADVMMPEMDGFQLTESLKTNVQTSHIPIILLTALKSHEHQERGFSAGADDYVSKPVSMQLLHLKIGNQLRTRFNLSEKIRQKYELSPSTGIAGNKSSSLDEIFLQKAIKIVDEHLDDTGFDVDEFAFALNMSRSGLYRKFEAIVNVSPAVFLKTQRLKRAAEKILNGSATITEIAYDVGFTDAANFTRSFKQHFGCPPSKYKAMVSRE